LAVVAGMKKTNDHAEPTKVEKKRKKEHLGLLMKQKVFYLDYFL